MFTPIGSLLLLLTIVLVAIFVRETTDYIPDSPVRLWTTRIAVYAIIFWLGFGLLRAAVVRGGHSWLYVVASRSFIRGVCAIVIVWVVFRDEL